jgi:hypothetical protein
MPITTGSGDGGKGSIFYNGINIKIDVLNTRISTNELTELRRAYITSWGTAQGPEFKP